MRDHKDILEELYKILQPFVPQNLEIEEETDLVAD